MNFNNVFFGKSKFKQASVILCSAMLASGAYAAEGGDGDITFNGKVYAPTCSVVGTDKHVTVMMPHVSSSALSGNGTTFGHVPFQIKLTGCNLAANKTQKVGLLLLGNETGAANVLDNAAAGTIATGVGIAIYNHDGSKQLVINGNHHDNQDLAEVDASTEAMVDGSVQIPLVAKYYNYSAGATPVAGDVVAKATFSVTYQ